jgi:hypothetical protein
LYYEKKKNKNNKNYLHMLPNAIAIWIVIKVDTYEFNENYDNSPWLWFMLHLPQCIGSLVHRIGVAHVDMLLLLLLVMVGLRLSLLLLLLLLLMWLLMGMMVVVVVHYRRRLGLWLLLWGQLGRTPVLFVAVSHRYARYDILASSRC